MIFYFAEWAKGVWDSDFTEVETLDDSIVEELNLVELTCVLDRLNRLIDYWVKNKAEEG